MKIQTTNRPTNKQVATWRRAMRALRVAEKALNEIGASDERCLGVAYLQLITVDDDAKRPWFQPQAEFKTHAYGTTPETAWLVLNPFEFPSIMLGSMADLIDDYARFN